MGVWQGVAMDLLNYGHGLLKLWPWPVMLFYALLVATQGVAAYSIHQSSTPLDTPHCMPMASSRTTRREVETFGTFYLGILFRERWICGTVEVVL
jgi:hypothetical protein